MRESDGYVPPGSPFGDSGGGWPAVWSGAPPVSSGKAVLAVTLAGLAMGIGAWAGTFGAWTVLLAGAMALLRPRAMRCPRPS